MRSRWHLIVTLYAHFKQKFINLFNGLTSQFYPIADIGFIQIQILNEYTDLKSHAGVVLVSADSIKSLKAAYPSHFADTILLVKKPRKNIKQIRIKNQVDGQHKRFY